MDRAYLRVFSQAPTRPGVDTKPIHPTASQSRPMSPAFYQLKYPFPVPDEVPAVAAGFVYAVDVDGSFLTDVDGSLLVIPA